MHIFCQRLLLLSAVIFLQACQESDELYKERPVEDIYTEAMTRLNAGSFSKAAESFAEVERQHPYSNWALRAQLMSGFAYYQAKKYDEAIESFSVFMGLHPMHKDVPYAQYMIGMCHYEQVPIVSRDQQPTEKALTAFQDVISRYPESSYAKDAKIKIDFIQDHLAGKEMDIGRYYQKQGNHLAAVNRFKAVVDQFQTTSHVPEALFRLVESYLSLGLRDQASASAAVLGHNYPGSTWYQEGYALLTGKKVDEATKKVS
jgi:outer membrane protein assembly factor BamD